MIVKYALRNIIRLPKQALLCALIAAIVAASLVTGAIVYSATGRAISRLNEEYVFVATLTPKSAPVDNKLEKTEFSFMTLKDFSTCYSESLCKAYNVSFAGTDISFAGEDMLFDISDTDGKAEDELCDVWEASAEPNVTATANLYLEAPFFNAGAVITEGRSFSKDGYLDNTQETVIPRSAAEKYNIRIGDLITICMGKLRLGMASQISYSQCEVVGIYEAPDGTACPAYVTEAYYINRYLALGGGNVSSHQIYRADYVLGSRDDFPAFVQNAKGNGLDLTLFKLEFNNSEYDKTLEGLINVKSIVVISVSVISAVGVGLFVFFTAFFKNGRKRERETLRHLGMSRLSVFICFTLELALIIAISAPIGGLAGDIATGAVFDYINEEALREEKNVEKSAIPLEQQRYQSLENRLEVSVSKSDGGTIDKPDISYCDAKKNGYSRILHIDYLNIIRKVSSETHESEYTNPVGITILAVEDLENCGLFELSSPYINDETKMALNAYIPEDFVFPASETERIICSYTKNRMIILYIPAEGHGSVYEYEGKIAYGTYYINVVGTYKHNELCDGNTIIIDLSKIHNRILSTMGYADGYIETVSNGN